MKITKVCEFCDKPFIAKTSVTRYCSHVCNRKAYKKKQKEQKVQNAETTTKQHIRSAKNALYNPPGTAPNLSTTPEGNNKYLSIIEAYTFLKISRATLYRLIKNGELKVKKVKNRTFLKKSHLLNLFE